MIYWYRDEAIAVLCRITPYYLPVCLGLFVLNLVVTASSGIFLPDQHWKFGLIGGYANLVLSSCLIVILLKDGKRVMPARLDRAMGDLSYPLYVFHWAGAGFASWLIYGEAVRGLHMGGMVVFIVGSVFAVLVSFVVNKFVNERVELIRVRVKHVAGGTKKPVLPDAT